MNVVIFCCHVTWTHNYRQTMVVGLLQREVNSFYFYCSCSSSSDLNYSQLPTPYYIKQVFHLLHYSEGQDKKFQLRSFSALRKKILKKGPKKKSIYTGAEACWTISKVSNGRFIFLGWAMLKKKIRSRIWMNDSHLQPCAEVTSRKGWCRGGSKLNNASTQSES